MKLKSKTKLDGRAIYRRKEMTLPKGEWCNVKVSMECRVKLEDFCRVHSVSMASVVGTAVLAYIKAHNQMEQAGVEMMMEQL